MQICFIMKLFAVNILIHSKNLLSRWQSRRIWGLPLLKNTSKLQLHIEGLSLMLTWELAKQVFYNQDYKERSTWSLLGREEKQFDWGRRRGYPKLDPPWGVRGSNHILRTSGLRSITKKTNHCSQFENQWGLLKDDTKERLQTWEACAQSCLLLVTTQRQLIGNCLGPWLACQDWPCMPLGLHWAPFSAYLAPVLLFH